MTESDYFTAIDDLVQEEGEQGSGHINASELTSGLYYGYVVVDVNGLARNLGEDRSLAGEVANRLVYMVSTVSPGAKKGSTAPYAYSHLVLAESGSRQPRTLQNAFIEPVRPSPTGDLVQPAYATLRRHLAELDAMYGKAEQRAHAGLYTVTTTDGRESAIFENKMTLPELATWARERVLS
jgi:CRISPR system Cascade subunit CasC